MDMLRAHVWISGRVQGVFFRSKTYQQAQSLGVYGWVKNCPDKRVEAVFEGEQAAVEKLIAWCRHGPSFARVQEVQVEWKDFKGEFSAFNIRGW